MSLLNIDMAQADEIIPHVRQGLTYWMKGASVSANMLSTMSNQINSVPAC